MQHLNHNLVQQIINTCPLGLVVFDIDQNIIDINEYGAKLLGRTPDELIGFNLNDYIFTSNGGIGKACIEGLDKTCKCTSKHEPAFGITGTNDRVKLRLQINYLNDVLAYAIFHDPSEYAVTDTLTDALTREQFFSAVEKVNEEFSLLFIDLNKFKIINDTHGHTVGDFVLKTIAKRISNVLRDDDIFCRYGGDEFIVVLPGNTEHVETVRDKLMLRVQEPVTRGRESLDVSCSIGISISTESKSIDKLIQLADERMYTLKDGYFVK